MSPGRPLNKLDELLDILHETQGDIIGRRLEIALCIDPYDRLGIGSAEMHPIVVEFDLQAIFGIDGVILVFLFDLVQDRGYINAFPQFDLILGYEVIRVPGPEGPDPVLMMG